MEDTVGAGEVEAVLRQVDALNLDTERGERARVVLLERRLVVIGETVDPEDVVAVCAKRGRARCDPMNPAAPMTTYRISPGG